MKVFGLDFSTSKLLTLARCELDGRTLRVRELRDLTSSDRREQKKNPFAILEAWLSKEEGPWIAGMDFPFGQPVEAVEHFQWLNDTDQKWIAYVRNIRSTHKDKKEFKTTIESWRHPVKINKKGERVRVRKYRLCDLLAESHSPMNCIRPPVGQMFFEGVSRLCDADLSIQPVRVKDSCARHVVEAYPRLVADKWVRRSTPYKGPRTRAICGH
jgi:hypothetical protein